MSAMSEEVKRNRSLLYKALGSLRKEGIERIWNGNYCKAQIREAVKQKGYVGGWSFHLDEDGVMRPGDIAIQFAGSNGVRQERQVAMRILGALRSAGLAAQWQGHLKKKILVDMSSRVPDEVNNEAGKKMKRCRYCGVEKDESEFWAGPNGHLRWKCKACYMEDLAERRRAGREARRIANGLVGVEKVMRAKIGEPIQFQAETGANYTVKVEKAAPGASMSPQSALASGVQNPSKPTEIRLTISAAA